MKEVVVVTGADGFVGRRLCASLRERGCLVRSLNRRSARIDENSFTMDLLDSACPEGLFLNANTVFHLAGKAHALAENRQDEAEYFQINTEGTRKLLEAAKQAGVQRFIYFSSVKAVGNSGLQTIDEAGSTPADTPYGQSKYAAEELVLNGGYIRHPVVIRPSMIYGDTDKGNLPRMIQSIAKSLFPPLPETHNRRSMVHVDDVVNAAILAAESPQAAGRIYIVTDGQAYSTRQIYDWIREALGKPPVDWSVPETVLTMLGRLGDVIGSLMGRRFPLDSDALDKLLGSAWYSSVKIEHELGFKPQQTFKESLPNIVRYLNL